jgi:hypothetical protein
VDDAACDDAIAGEEQQLSMSTADGRWRLVASRTRIHCRRGLDAASGRCA